LAFNFQENHKKQRKRGRQRGGGEKMNQQEIRFYESRKRTFEHYGVEMEDAGRCSVCNKPRNMLAVLGIIQAYIDPNKKTRVIIDYDPSFEEALIQVKED